MRRGGLDVGHHLGVVQLHAIPAALVDVLLGVAQLHTPLGPVEDRRRNDRIALGCETIAHVAHVVVDAEDLLDDDDPLVAPAGPAV